MNVASTGYFLATAAFVVLAILLQSSWRGGWRGGALVTAVFVTIAWSALAGYHALNEYPGSIKLAILELLRNAAWLAFLFLLLLTHGVTGSPTSVLKIRSIAVFVASVIVLMISVLVYADITQTSLPDVIGFGLRIFSHIILSVIGLLLVEQLFRNASHQQRWSIKYLCLGIGGIFAYDFYLYADAFLFNEMGVEIWDARGYINAMIVPLLAVSAARNPDWSLDVHVSRNFVFHTTTLMGAGIYLLSMAAAGYYINLYGGDWGGVAQVTFLFGALIVLGTLMFSGSLRARVRIFLSRNFFNYRYDYRDEWLRFINSLSNEKLDSQFRERVIHAVSEIVESPGGALWIKQSSDRYCVAAHINLPTDGAKFNTGHQSLIRFLEDRQWVIDIEEYKENPDIYETLELPDWMSELPQAWLIVPLLQQSQLYGFMILVQSRARQSLNWEDRDLLITTGRGATNYLALLDANDALFNARQFEAFNRLSAYVVHDLKNVIAQLALVVKNAEKHKHNPAFMDDAIYTVDNAVGKMDRMLAQLRKDRVVENESNTCRINLNIMVGKVVEQRQADLPKPVLETCADKIIVVADADRLASVIGHLVQNAQEATPDSGYVSVSLYKNNNQVVIKIKDTGCGMDSDFVRDRLFRPFDTTKGNAGMGIGVYESREFIQASGGSIDVETAPGKGTTFTIQLKSEGGVSEKDENQLSGNQ